MQRMFLNKYKFPLNLFIISENSKPCIYTSELVTSNHFICIINAKQLFLINTILKKELFYNLSSLIEVSGIDTFKYTGVIKDIFRNRNNVILYNHYYCYYTKLRLTLLYNYFLNGKSQITSIDSLYKNSS